MGGRQFSGCACCESDQTSEAAGYRKRAQPGKREAASKDGMAEEPALGPEAQDRSEESQPAGHPTTGDFQRTTSKIDARAECQSDCRTKSQSHAETANQAQEKTQSQAKEIAGNRIHERTDHGDKLDLAEIGSHPKSELSRTCEASGPSRTTTRQRRPP